MAEYIEREQVKDELLSWAVCIKHPEHLMREDALHVIDSIPAAAVAPVVHCKNCVYDKDCFIQKSLSIANIDNPYCCLGKRKARMDGE